MQRKTEPARWIIRAEPPSIDPAVGFVVVPVGEFIVPPRFTATVKRDDVDDFPTLVLEISMEGARPTVTQLAIGTDHSRGESSGVNPASRQREGQSFKRPVTASLLRELPLARLAKHAMLGVAWRLGETGGEKVVPWELRDDAGFYRIGPDEVPDDYGLYLIDIPAWDELWSDAMGALTSEVDRLKSTAPRRNRITDELLERVAAVYRRAIDDGTPPKQAVALAESVSKATAGRYVMKARERGFLGATSPGKKGEVTAQT